MDIQVSESAPIDVTYVGRDPVASYQPLGFQRRITITVAFIAAKLPASSFAPADSLTRWLHTMIYLRGGACGSTVKFPDQSLWAVHSYEIKMDATEMPRAKIELVGVVVPKQESGLVEMIGASPIEGLEEWMPKVKPCAWPFVEGTRDQILTALAAMVDRDLATVTEAASFETTGTLSPGLKKRVDAYIQACKQGKEPKKKIGRKDAFWKTPKTS